MEQSNGDSVVIDCVVWSRLEREIAEILLGMRDLMLEMDSDLKSPFQWGRKRKRSAIQGAAGSSSSSRFLLHPSYSPKTALPDSNGACSDGAGDGGGSGGVAAEAAAKVKKVKVKVKKVEASSPATPLSLSLTESDEKPNRKPLRSKASLKRKRDYYLKSIEDLSERKAKLNQEIEKVSCYCEELKAYNLKLKERKQEIINGLKREPMSQMGCEMKQQLVNPSNSMAQNQNHQLQVPNTPQILRLRINQSSGQAQSNLLLPMQPSNPPSASLTMVNNPNRGVVLDLNVSPEELVHVEPYQPMDVNVGNKDLNRVFMAAQARKRRIQINRLKNNPIANNNNSNNNNSNSKPRYSCRA